MTTDPQILADIRFGLLKQLRARQGVQVIPLALSHGLERAGVEHAKEDVQPALDYLEQKGLAKSEADPLSAGVRLWQITAAGIDHVEGRGG
jgi:hypothetical protein